MTEIEKAYIAGIIDGEGSICIERRANRKLSTPAVYVASIDRELLGGNDDGNNEATKAARVRGDVTGEAARDSDEGWPSRA